ncbi:hypothetical protein [Ktedonobacter racemifer]|uniref:hypothetical protein n=1 Tax=Ktedonobacter racemifer TaxID=363277 RepID=UPI0012F96EB7|nr:hypothetical protein [Ktedonobacter racemifer]
MYPKHILVYKRRGVQAIFHEFPDRCFDQVGRPPPGETAFDLFDAGSISPGPDLLRSQYNLSIGRKRLAPGMQEHQIVVALPVSVRSGANAGA